MAKKKEEGEVWKDVVGFENYYEVSSFGNVRSKTRVSINSLGRSVLIEGRVRTFDKSHRYLRVNLSVNGKVCKKFVHVLVAQCFVENFDPINKTQVDHIVEGDCRNNHYTNLQWLSSRENTVKHFSHKMGEGNYPGVSQIGNGRWRAKITLKKKGRDLGTFDTKEEAIRSYDEALTYVEEHSELPPRITNRVLRPTPNVAVHFSSEKRKFIGHINLGNRKKKYICSGLDKSEVEDKCEFELNILKNGKG